jgi:hypothetical protein
MNKNATLVLSEKDAAYQAQADRYIADSLKILKKLETERKRSNASRKEESNILADVKAILRGAR